MSQPDPLFSRLAITRLAHRAGVKTLGKPSHDEVCSAAISFLEGVIQRTTHVIDADRRITISDADVTKVVGAEPQAQTEPQPTPSIPRASFKRVLQTLTAKIKPRTRWAATAIGLLQGRTEAYLQHLFEDAGLCAAHADRETLMPKDIRLVLQLRGRV